MLSNHELSDDGRDFHDCDWKMCAVGALTLVLRMVEKKRQCETEEEQKLFDLANSVLFSRVLGSITPHAVTPQSTPYSADDQCGSEYLSIQPQTASSFSYKAAAQLPSTTLRSTGSKLSFRPATPQIPFDVLTHIMDWVATIDKQTVATCALVNHAWMSLARPKLWNTSVVIRTSLKSFRFLHALHRQKTCLIFLEKEQPTYCLPDSASYITQLEFKLTKLNLQAFYEALSRLQPSLRTLKLTGRASYRRLMDSVADHCPKSLKHLHIDVLKDDEDAEGNSSPYDHVKLRRFFSQLVEIRWMDGDADPDLVVDSGHCGLRWVQLPFGLSPDQLRQFIRRCFSGLIVIDLSLSVSHEDLALIGRSFPKLRVFCSEVPCVRSSRALQTFLKTAGSTLEYLSLPLHNPLRVDVIPVYCRSLAHLNISMTEPNMPSMAPEIMELLYGLGSTLKSFRFHLVDLHWTTIVKDLVAVTIMQCSNLEMFALTHGCDEVDWKEVDLGLLFGRCTKLKYFQVCISSPTKHAIDTWERSLKGAQRARNDNVIFEYTEGALKALTSK
ncbi:hypothetical protein HK102_004627 [Quaeritorhiza haematococci]|nr:hypothetical protein HK102_004627 [Quaeritorhiza haematococci]